MKTVSYLTRNSEGVITDRSFALQDVDVELIKHYSRLLDWYEEALLMDRPTVNLLNEIDSIRSTVISKYSLSSGQFVKALSEINRGGL